MAIEDEMSAAGVPYPISVEILRVLRSGDTASAEKFTAVGVPFPTALELASQINTRAPSAGTLTFAGLPPAASSVISVAFSNAAPAGYSRSTINGEPVTYLGFPVFDNGVNAIYLGA